MIPSIPALALRCLRTLRNMGELRRSQRGVGALEFALLAPVLVTSIAGLAAMSQAIRAKMLLTSAASSIASMVAVHHAVTGGSSGTLHDFCTGAQLIMQPYAAAGLSMAIASYTLQPGTTANPGPTASKDWENDSSCQGSAGSLASTGSDLATPLLVGNGDSVIIVQASYSFTSPYISILPSLALTQIAYSRPRYSRVTCASTC